MRLVIGGQSHELSYETVLEAAGQIVPEIFDGRHKYYVAVRGRRFPVKQLFSQATGRRRDEFITHDAIRNLRKLGFSVEVFHGPLSPARDFIAAEPDKINGIESTVSFPVSLEADEDGYIVATCPQLPGCHSQGKSREEAVKNIEEAIRGYLANMKQHGEEVPMIDWVVVKVDL